MIPPQAPLNAHPGGDGRPAALEIHRTRNQEQWPRAPTGRPPAPEARAGGLSPGPTPPPGSSPHTVSISRGNWCYLLVLLSSWGGGRRVGQPLGDPHPGSSEDGADASWAVPPPPAHQEPPPAAVQLVPKHLKPQSWIRSQDPSSPWVRSALSPPSMAVPHNWGTFGVRRTPTHTGNSPLALVESMCPSIHPTVHLFILVPS